MASNHNKIINEKTGTYLLLLAVSAAIISIPDENYFGPIKIILSILNPISQIILVLFFLFGLIISALPESKTKNFEKINNLAKESLMHIIYLFIFVIISIAINLLIILVSKMSNDLILYISCSIGFLITLYFYYKVNFQNK